MLLNDLFQAMIDEQKVYYTAYDKWVNIINISNKGMVIVEIDNKHATVFFNTLKTKDQFEKEKPKYKAGEIWVTQNNPNKHCLLVYIDGKLHTVPLSCTYYEVLRTPPDQLDYKIADSLKDYFAVFVEDLFTSEELLKACEFACQKLTDSMVFKLKVGENCKWEDTCRDSIRHIRVERNNVLKQYKSNKEKDIATNTKPT